MTIPSYVETVLVQLEANGYQGWCVGGCVRDLLLARTPQDWDVTTDATPQQVLALFGDSAKATGLQHGTVTVCANGSPAVEVTTFRIDGAYEDHRHPVAVTFTPSLQEDLRRRDFTINAMALSRSGQLEDPFGGREDLSQGILRAVGDPTARFTEDALRIMRGLRFASQLGFSVESATAQAIHQQRELLSKIAVERILVEMNKLLCGEYAVPVLREFPDVLGVFWGGILPMVGLSQDNPHHCYDLWEHTIRTLGGVGCNPVLRYTALLHDVGKVPTFTHDDQGVGHFYRHPQVGAAMAQEMLNRLRMDNDTKQKIVTLILWHDKVIPPTHRGVKRALSKLGVVLFGLLLEIKRADNLAQHPAYQGRQQELDVLEGLFAEVLAQDACFSLQKLAVNGGDLLALGMEGRAIGEALSHLLTLVIDEQLSNEKPTLLAYLGEEFLGKDDV